MSLEIHEKILKKKCSIACAESCTGGALSASFTRYPGASKYFKGGLVAYCNQIKKKILNVSQDTLDDFGAVSKETVEEMAMEACLLFGADIAIAVSGIAGPDGGSSEKPVGTVCIGIYASNTKLFLEQLHFDGPRDIVIEKVCKFCLNKLDHLCLQTF